jgi:hypothetical protein
LAILLIMLEKRFLLAFMKTALDKGSRKSRSHEFTSKCNEKNAYVSLLERLNSAISDDPLVIGLGIKSSLLSCLRSALLAGSLT